MKVVSAQALIYLRDPNHFIELLKSTGDIEDNKFLFTADVVVIYSNIDREEAITTLLFSFETKLIAYDKDLLVKPLI